MTARVLKRQHHESCVDPALKFLKSCLCPRSRPGWPPPTCSALGSVASGPGTLRFQEGDCGGVGVLELQALRVLGFRASGFQGFRLSGCRSVRVYSLRLMEGQSYENPKWSGCLRASVAQACENLGSCCRQHTDEAHQPNENGRRSETEKSRSSRQRCSTTGCPPTGELQSSPIRKPK